jgi:hypothetical protein
MTIESELSIGKKKYKRFSERKMSKNVYTDPDIYFKRHLLKLFGKYALLIN